MYKKTWITLSFVYCILFGLLLRLWHITSTQPAKVISSQNHWTVLITNTRGTIYDRNLRPLVNEHYIYRAAVAPSKNVLRAIRDYTSDECFVVLRSQLSAGKPATVDLLKPLSNQDDIYTFQIPMRYSDYVPASHIIGHLDDAAQHGATGIEHGYDAILTEYNGSASASFSVNAGGQHLAGVTPVIRDTTNLSKGGVVLTLDKVTQTVIEEIGSKMLPKGAIIVLRANSDEILSMASFPNYQPSAIADSIKRNDGALTNRALALYDCGSVFKIVTTAAALENGISVETTFNCSGAIEVAGTCFHCHNRDGHGELTMNSAFAQSCNCYYIQLAQVIGTGNLYSTVQRLGLQRALSPANGITASEPVLPNINTLASDPISLANFSFGQGYLLMSPLHISQLTSIIANQGILYSPNLIYGITDENACLTASSKRRGEQAISRQTALNIQSMMLETVKNGTGYAAATDAVNVAGKTGTAETGQYNKQGERIVQSWFTGYFPAENPQYIITVLAEDAQATNTKSAQIFREICNELLLVN